MTEVEDAVDVVRGDLTQEQYDAAARAGAIAWDIETSGLDWSADRIGTCQIATPTRAVVVVLDQHGRPERLADLLERDDVLKVFHHAPFDLRFMMSKWVVTPRNVACTKVASKILNPTLDNGEHSLKPVLSRHLGVTISKDMQVSDWLSSHLSQEQLTYAASDVVYLLGLLDSLLRECAQAGVSELVTASFEYLPARVALDLRGAGDVFAY